MNESRRYSWDKLLYTGWCVLLGPDRCPHTVSYIPIQYHFILSANSSSLLSLSLYLASTFFSFLSLSLYLVSTFIFIIINLSCQYHPSYQKKKATVIFLCNPGSIDRVRTHFLLSWTSNFNFSVHILVLKKVKIVAVVLLLIVINDVDRDLVCP